MTKILIEKMNDAKRYCWKRFTHRRINEKVFRMAKKYGSLPCIVFERVNVPTIGKVICEYHILDKYSIDGRGFILIHLYDEMDNLILFTDGMYVGLTNGNITKKPGIHTVTINRHALQRFVERHRWNGTMEQLEDHLLLNSRQYSFKEDMITHEVICPFDGGVFLGVHSNGEYILKTFVMDRQLYFNQKMDEKQAENFKKEYLKTTPYLTI